jgi:hypothetical protein
MKAHKSLTAIALVFIMTLLSAMNAGAITRADLKKFPVHYSTISYSDAFTKCFSKDSRGRYRVKGEKPMLLVINIKGCRPCISARLFLNWMVDFHSGKDVDFYEVMISDSDKSPTQLYDLAEQFGIPSSGVRATPIIMLFNSYGNLVFHDVGFPVESSLPFIKGVEEVPVWNHFSPSKSYGEKIQNLLRAYDNL